MFPADFIFGPRDFTQRLTSGELILIRAPISSPEFSGSSVSGGSPGRTLGTRKKYDFCDWLSLKQCLGGSRSYRKSSKNDISFHWLWLISGSQHKRKEEGEMFWR